MTDETLSQSFKALAALQSLDTGLHQLTHRRSNLPEATELQALQRKQADLEVARRELEETNSDLMARQEDLARAIARQVQRHHELERQMQASTGTASRDLAAMDAELHRLAEHQRQLEDEELLLLEEAEPIDEALQKVSRSLAEGAAAMEEVRSRGRTAVAEIDAARVAKEGERASVVATVPADLLQTYDRVRAKVGVVAVARLQGHRCDGCNLELPAVEVDRISKLPIQELAMCDHCGRILLRVDQLR